MPDTIPGVNAGNVDEEMLANNIGRFLTSIGANENSAQASTNVGPLGDTPDVASLYSQGKSIPVPTTPSGSTQPGVPTGLPTSQSTIDTGETADPVPSGTTVSQGWGGDGGHPGVDLAVPVGTTIVAAISGKVTMAGNTDPHGYGNEIEITSPAGIVTRYGHLSYVGQKEGDQVKAGQPIGKSGGEQGAPGSGDSTGPHLHFEVRKDGHSIDPVPYLAGGAQVLHTVPEGATASIPTFSSQDAADSAVGRVQGALVGKDPGSESGTKTVGGDKANVPANTSGSINPQATTAADGDPAGIDAFLNATKQHESSGDYTARNNSGQSNAAGAYQFIGTTWKSWGGTTDSAADASPAEQDAVARKMATALFNQFHSWRLVAIAWYGGPGIAEQVARGQDPGAPEGQGRYIDYGNTIMQMMSGGK